MVIGAEFESILGAAQAGEEWAFSVLYRDLNPPLVRYLSARAPGAGEDLAAETWLGAARGLASFAGGEAAFRAWLFTIGRRRLIEQWRHNGVSDHRPVDPAALIDAPGGTEPEAEVVGAMSARLAAQSIAGALSPDQADVVLLRVLAGLDVEQVAVILGKRPGTVRVLQHKALRRLARHLSVEALTL